MADDETHDGLPLATTIEVTNPVNPAALAGTAIVVKGSMLEAELEKERLRDPEVRQQLKEAARETELAALRASVHPISINELRGHTAAHSLRQAGVELVEQLGGAIRVEDGHAIIDAPPIPSQRWQTVSEVRELVETLVAGADIIVATAGKQTGAIDPADLPDQLVGAAGGLL